jgi:light-regulated signal transduction histidine kinase (bacteriophytochrome)
VQSGGAANGCSERYRWRRPGEPGCDRRKVGERGNGPSGRPRFSFIAEDITERKKHEDLPRRSNEELKRANADLEQFAYSASLDLLAYSQSMRSFDSAPQLVDTNEVLETVKKNLATRIQETGFVISAGDLPAVYGDPVPLMHVFQNLVSNALKYRGEAPPMVSVWAEKHPGFWRLAVRDNGIGIAKQFHEQIFGIFKRLHPRNEYPGTGIGLAICQKVVERYGGRIWVESEEGQGSTFFFTLPD